MAWDFETDPEYQAQLDWADRFVREEVEPEKSEILVFVRAVATALVAAVVGNLVVFPSGALAETALLLRISAAALGFAAYLLLGRAVLAGIVASEFVLGAGIWLGF